MKEILLFAHRGASGHAPDNTLEAFELALQMGTHAIESDVKLTRDRHLVFFHDFGLGHGARFRPVSWLSLAKMRAKVAGGAISAPKVADIFAHFRGQAITWSIDARGRGQARKLIQAAKQNGFLDTLYIASEGYRARKAWVAAGLPPGNYIWSIRNGRIQRWGVEKVVDTCQREQIGILNIKLEWMTPELHDAIRAAGIALYIWDCHAEAQVRNALAYRPDAIYSNFPDIAGRIIREAESE